MLISFADKSMAVCPQFPQVFVLFWLSDLGSLNPEQQIDFPLCVSQHRLISLITSSHMLSTYLLAMGKGKVNEAAT